MNKSQKLVIVSLASLLVGFFLYYLGHVLASGNLIIETIYFYLSMTVYLFVLIALRKNTNDTNKNMNRYLLAITAILMLITIYSYLF